MHYLVLEPDYEGSHFHGCFGNLELATEVANKHQAIVYKADLWGNSVELLATPKSYEVHSYDVRGKGKVLVAKVNTKLEAMEAIKQHFATYHKKPDELSFPGPDRDYCIAEVYTTITKYKPDGETYLQGGHRLRHYAVTVKEWQYEDTEIPRADVQESTTTTP